MLAIAIHGDLTGETAVHRIVPGQVCIDIGIAQIIDGYNFNLIIASGFI